MGKKFGDLRKDQRLRMQGWLFDAYCQAGDAEGCPPPRRRYEEIIRAAYRRAQQEDIVISLEEVRRYYTSKVPRFRKRFERGDRRLAG